MLSVDIAAIAALLWWRPNAGLPASNAATEFDCVPGLPFSPGWRRVAQPSFLAALVPCLAVGVPAGWLASHYREPAGRVTSGEPFIVAPEGWIGKELPLVSNIDIGHELVEGEWIVLLYHHDCPKCQEAVARYVQGAEAADGSVARIALIEVPPWGAIGSSNGDGCRHGRLDQNRDWFVETPTHLLVSSGVVRAVSREVIDADTWPREVAARGAAGLESHNKKTLETRGGAL
ncbi:MAG TPA: hypothetical protein VHY91_12360 [Pirellulales bacterium]|jgi:hypothetical protein|nr:hypothetical protein [Pirellulales bacterium]